MLQLSRNTVQFWSIRRSQVTEGTWRAEIWALHTARYDNFSLWCSPLSHHHFCIVAVQRPNHGWEFFEFDTSQNPQIIPSNYHICLFACSNGYFYITQNVLWPEYWPCNIVAWFLVPPGGNSHRLIWYILLYWGYKPLSANFALNQIL